MIQKPLFFTDKNRNVILEAILGTPNAAIPDSLKPFEVLNPTHPMELRKSTLLFWRQMAFTLPSQ